MYIRILITYVTRTILVESYDDSEKSGYFQSTGSLVYSYLSCSTARDNAADEELHVSGWPSRPNAAAAGVSFFKQRPQLELELEGSQLELESEPEPHPG